MVAGAGRRRLVRIVRDHDITTLELMLAVYTITWGVAAIMPWASFSIGMSYAIMARIAPEWVWGVVTMAVGTSALVGLLGGAEPWAIRVRQTSTRLMALYWLLQAVLTIWATNFASLFGPPQVVISIASIWVYVRLHRGR